MKSFVSAALFVSFNLFGATEITPTAKFNQSLTFADDMQLANLEKAIDRQLLAYQAQGLTGKIRFGKDTYSKGVLKDSLELLKALAVKTKKCLKANKDSACLNAFNKDLNEKFTIYRPVAAKTEPGYRKSATTKFTSYYSPDLTGSRTPTARFKRPVYALPSDVSEQNHTRVEIDYHGALAGKGLELFWVEESFYDLYLLHVQGGGRIKVMNPDGSYVMKYLSYAGKNTRTFQMVYKYMIAKGYLKPGNAGIPGQRRFLEENPDKEEEVFNTCPSYIYFKESLEEPVGLDDIPLTEGRSLAIDNTIYKTMGMINFVKTVKASHVDANGKVVKVPFSRFFISQDTGGSIRGNARVDLYFGYGPQAELTAYNMNEQGEQYFLVKK
ncbi:MAG TPA: MltA domain-containing protein [Bacteriovoracaceae bacterium]|nr:MltA domain-containing protein [Bacteriovoracaceae bacterium]